MTITTSQPAVPGSIDLDQVVPPEIRAELAEILDELNALEPQLESIGRRAYDAHRRAEAAQSAAVDALAAVPGVDRVDIVDGASELFAVLSGSSAVFDTAVRIGGHLHVWTGCASKPPAWLDEIDKGIVAGVTHRQRATTAPGSGSGASSRQLTFCPLWVGCPWAPEDENCRLTLGWLTLPGPLYVRPTTAPGRESRRLVARVRVRLLHLDLAE